MKKWSKAKKKVMQRRRIASGTKHKTKLSGTAKKAAPLGGRMKVVRVKKVPCRGGSEQMVELTCAKAMTLRGAGLTDPVVELGKAISHAIDPTRVCGPVRRLVDMSPEERARLEKDLGAPIKPAEPKKVDPSLLVPITIEGVTCRGATEAGLRISYQGKAQWIPKSMLLEGTVLHTPGCSGKIVVPRWFALKHGLITGLNGILHEERDFMRGKLADLIGEWRKRIREESEDLSSEFYRGLRVGMRSCALELVRVVKMTGGAAFYEQRKLEVHHGTSHGGAAQGAERALQG